MHNPNFAGAPGWSDGQPGAVQPRDGPAHARRATRAAAAHAGGYGQPAAEVRHPQDGRQRPGRDRGAGVPAGSPGPGDAPPGGERAAAAPSAECRRRTGYAAP